jgi:CHAT domain-containing protein/tetratricopeptide (TPR) repeat protein
MRALLGWVVFSSLLVACQSAPPTQPPMSLDEAKQITASFEDQGYVPPPRTTLDIAATLEQMKPDVSALAARRAIADAPTPPNATALFYFRRGQTLRYEGRIREAIADLTEAVRLSPLDGNYLLRLGDLLAQGGYPIEAGQAYSKVKSGPGNALFSAINLSDVHASLGDFVQADRDLDSARRQYDNLASRSTYALAYRSAIEAQQGYLFKYRGDYAGAEKSFRLGMADTDWIVANWNPAWEAVSSSGNVSSGGAQKEVNVQRSITMKRQIADVYRLRGTLNEAEYWIRRALMQSIEMLGVNAPSTVAALKTMSIILADQGRYSEAQRLGEIALAKVKMDSPRSGSTVVVDILCTIGAAAIAQAKTQEALDAFEAALHELVDSPEIAKQLVGINLDYAIALRGAGRIDDALRVAQAAADWRTRTVGPESPSTVLARGYVASFLAAAGDVGGALAEFQAIMPQLMSLSQSASAAGAIDRNRKAQELLNDYIRLLATMRGTSLEQRIPGGVSGEAFRVADLARGRGVHQALIESGARTAISDMALADLARREQDTWYQIAARERVLADAQSLGTNQQDSPALERLHVEVEQLRVARATLRAEIVRRFPSYASMTQPEPASLDQARAALGVTDALISIYSTESESYVWAVPKQGTVAFATIPHGRTQLTKTVAELRRSLDPHATNVGDIPPFDVALAYEVYSSVLGPVEAGWKGAKQLVVVPHGPLAELPFSLLVTRRVAQPASRSGTAVFSEYRDVPFLARDVAVTQVPTVAAFASLRAQAPGNAARRPFVGFGDPWFTAQQAVEAQRESVEEQASPIQARGLRLRVGPSTETLASATLSVLPRLPDTAAEVREVGIALHADPAKDVFLGAAANERQVRTMKLDDRRVVMFATHGLVPGDLNGLAQPALALSAPSVANVEGDGLLTMEKILSLRLDADWVVLSACNTAAGNGAGAEAVSGLGRAFFYAGARALLVTNWPVETTSARALTTAVFRLEGVDPSLPRAEALRQAMMTVMDGPGAIDKASGRTLYSYAHPIFWAPFSLVGDGR